MITRNWEDCTLWTTLRSPFARRVRIHFQRLGIPYHEKRIDLFNLSSEDEKELMILNPLGRIPVLQFKSGEVLVDSNWIIKEAYEFKDLSHYHSNASLELQKRIEVLSIGHCENLVQYFLMKQMSGKTDHPYLQDLETAFALTLNQLNQLQLSTQAFLPVHFDLGIALDYTLLRWKSEALKDHSHLIDLHQRFLEQTEAQVTQPPLDRK